MKQKEQLVSNYFQGKFTSYTCCLMFDPCFLICLSQKDDRMKGCMLSLAGRLTSIQQKEVSIDKLYKVLEMTEVDGSDRRQVYSLILRGFGKSVVG